MSLCYKPQSKTWPGRVSCWATEGFFQGSVTSIQSIFASLLSVCLNMSEDFPQHPNPLSFLHIDDLSEEHLFVLWGYTTPWDYTKSLSSFPIERVEHAWTRMDATSLEVHQGQAGEGPGQPDLVGGSQPTAEDGAVRSLPISVVLWFYDKVCPAALHLTVAVPKLGGAPLGYPPSCFTGRAGRMESCWYITQSRKVKGKVTAQLEGQMLQWWVETDWKHWAGFNLGVCWRPSSFTGSICYVLEHSANSLCTVAEGDPKV